MKIEPTNWLTSKITEFLVAHTPRCKDITRLLSASLDRKLPLRQRLGIRLHFLICVWCERYGEHLGWLRRWSHEAPEHAHEKLSDDARERLKRALREQS
jgi:hypothetical protein